MIISTHLEFLLGLESGRRLDAVVSPGDAVQPACRELHTNFLQLVIKYAGQSLRGNGWWPGCLTLLAEVLECLPRRS